MTIALIGCGKMGGAILKGWQSSKEVDDDILIYDPLARHGDPLFFGTELFNKLGDFLKSVIRADTIVLAIKPQIMNEVCASLKPGISHKALIISVAAGQTIRSFKDRFNEEQPVIRTMPNTPASIGKAMTVATTCPECTDLHKRKAEMLMKAIGQVEWIDDETLMDNVTAISGCGPAYVFYMIEVLAQAGEKAGLEKTLAMKLAKQTVIGSAALAESDSGTPVEKLRENVTSPGGVTKAALEVLMTGQMQKIFDKAISAAIKRSRELNT